ncbi:MAG TPA: Fic family protein [Candidatus Limnocylindrales bacterium]|nr:Fic family protein [Candidatus Limnocylindrales bacterium]
MISSECPDWAEDRPADLALIVANVAALWGQMLSDATTRPAPALTMALDWHRRIYSGVAVPHLDYVGHIRDSDPQHPCLVDYEARVGLSRGTRARDVPAAVDAFVAAAASVTSTLDAAIPVGAVPSAPGPLTAVIRLCAFVHGEWVRIHPFANGNGRIARVWANWLAVRYGLPPFVRIKPRPDDVLFVGAVELSMRGDHGPTEAMFASMLHEVLGAG